MAIRQIAFDTETTGLRPEDGHRIIEVGCVEILDRRLTGNHLHFYLNPEREVEAGALAVHGLTNEFLSDKPLFGAMASTLIDFIQGAELIIHNAPFDVGFINHELSLTRQGWKPLSDYCTITDTLPLARQMHVGQRNSLDALCKRYFIDNSKRDLHGALMDANLLAQVYLAMTGGQGSFFDHLAESVSSVDAPVASVIQAAVSALDLPIIYANEVELAAHAAYLQKIAKN